MEVKRVGPPRSSREFGLQHHDLILYLSPLRIGKRIVRGQKLERKVVPLRNMWFKKPFQHLVVYGSDQDPVCVEVSCAQFDKRSRIPGENGASSRMWLANDVIVKLSVIFNSIGE